MSATPRHHIRHSRKTIRLLACAALIAASCTQVQVSAAPTGTRSTLAGPAPPCDSSFNPYDYTPEQLAVCGIETFSQTGIRQLPGGGQAAQYGLHGVLVEQLLAPEDFDPLTATDAELARYGFPGRPTDPDLLRHWRETLAHWSGSGRAPPFLASIPATAG